MSNQMSHNRYPRAGDYVRLRPNTSHCCQYIGCDKPATHERTVQFGYMRGSDDASVKICDEHKRIPEGDVQAWVQHFPQEAWKG